MGERELMAGMVAHWISCAFCVGAHRATAVRGLEPAIVDACLTDYRTAPIFEPPRATLAFLEIMTLRPGDLQGSDVRAAMDAGMSRVQLTDAPAVTAVFNILTRYADAQTSPSPPLPSSTRPRACYSKADTDSLIQAAERH